MYSFPFLGSRLALTVTMTVALALSLTACGGGGNSDQTVAPSAPTGHGELKSATPLGTLPVSAITQALSDPATRFQGIKPVYSVTSYRLDYLTSDAQGQLVRASGLVSVPVKAAGTKSPVLSYQHATTYRNAEAPSNHAVATEVAIGLASLGYIVVAPDYVGYGSSLGTPHPYLLSSPSAAAVVDLLTAAKTWRGKNQVNDNGQLFMTGYSEGAYVTMAAHRALQESNAPELQQLRMEVSGAGPYDVQATLDGLLDLVRQEQPALAALLDPGFLRFLSSSVRDRIRSEMLKHLLPEDADVSFDARFIDYYLADDVQAIARLSSVHDWRPNVPVKLFHGRDDRTVPYASSLSTLRTMQSRGAGNLVSLTDCTASPSEHIACVPSFLNFMLAQFGTQAKDL